MLSDFNPWADDPQQDASRPRTAWTNGITPDYLTSEHGAAQRSSDLMPLMRNAFGVPQAPSVAQVAQLRGMDANNVPATQKQRFAALLVDGLIYGGVVSVLMMIMGVFGLDTSVGGALFISLLATPLGFFGYRALAEGLFEGSPGKHVMGLKVVGPQNLPISNEQAAKRNLWHLAAMFPPAWFIAAGIMGINGGTDPLKQNSADRWSNTQVVHKKPEEELARRELRRAEIFGPQRPGQLR